MGGIDLEIINFEEFKIYQDDNNYSFLYADFDDESKFLPGFISYIFNEENLLLYTELSTGIKFNPGKREYVKLYKNIQYFLNEELEKIPVIDLDDEIEKILNEEYECLKGEDGKLLIKPDKIGKIGEYIFHLLLTKYFGYECIIPKFRITTDRNMSAFGIDTLFYDNKKREILFGEAKFPKTLKNGVGLVNCSLKGYEQNMREEYLLVLSNDNLMLNSSFLNEYKDTIDVCKTLEEFIKESNTTTVVIPIFIAHGGDYKGRVEKIFNTLKRIKKCEMLGLTTKYLIISLPIIDKEKFTEIAIRTAVSKSNEYKQK